MLRRLQRGETRHGTGSSNEVFGSDCSLMAWPRPVGSEPCHGEGRVRNGRLSRRLHRELDRWRGSPANRRARRPRPRSPIKRSNPNQNKICTTVVGPTVPPCVRHGLEASLGGASRRGCGQCGQLPRRAQRTRHRRSWQLSTLSTARNDSRSGSRLSAGTSSLRPVVTRWRAREALGA
jgi:hypothetical protein